MKAPSIRGLALAFALTFVLVRCALAGASLAPATMLPAGKRHAHEPAAAFGKDVYLVVWRAGRNEKADILAARVSPDGKVLDAEPITVSSAEDLQEQPAVAFGGGNFLVVWSDLRGGKDYDLYGARVSVSGKVLDPDGIALCAEPTNQCKGAVTFDGKAFVAVWADYRNAKEVAKGKLTMSGHVYETFFTRVSPDGKPLGPKGAPALTGSTYDWPDVTIGGGGDVLVASEYGFGLLKDGPIKSITKYGKVIRGGRAFTPAVAASGKGYLVFVGDLRPMGRAGGGGKYGMVFIVDATGKIVKQTHVTAKPSPVLRPDAAWDGSAYVASWTVRRSGDRRNPKMWEEVFLSRLAEDGVLLDEKLAVAGSFEAPARLPVLASDGAGATLIAYEQHPKTAQEFIRVGVRLLKAK